jgi:pimeloyl-ACP methyl ester carboxylesterase
VHFDETPGRDGETPLLCLHPLPYSGRYFDTIAPLLAAGGRRLLRPDYPGYGLSDPLEDELDIESWAAALWQALDDLAVPGPLDLLGFHTGCLVGPELARQAPERVRSLALVDVPWFPGPARAEKARLYGAAPVIDGELDSLQGAWQRNVAGKLEELGPDRCLFLLSEELRPGTRVNEGFRAAFAYDLESSLRGLTQPTLVIATGGPLYGPSLAAADLVPGARHRELPSLTRLPFELGAGELSETVLEFLAGLPA